jgi:hypothetical protein
MKTERAERLVTRHSGKGPFPTLLGLVTGVALMSSGIALPVQSARAQGAGVAASHGLALVPGAPHWVKHASASARLRFTPKWQDLKQTAAAIASAPEGPSTNAAVIFGQTVFNKSSSALPQNGTTLALDPLDGNRIVGGYNDYRGLVSANFTGWSISTDGGATVAKNGQLPAVTLLGVSVPSQGDPVVAVDKTGNFFLGSTHFDAADNDPNGITLFRSRKAGSAVGLFSAACPGGTDPDCWDISRVVVAEPCTSAGGGFNEKPWIAVDQSSSVAAGSVYVVWSRLGCASGDESSTIFLTKCANTLTTCSPAVALETTPGTGSPLDFVQLPHLAVGPTGQVYVTWVLTSGASPAAEAARIRLKVITPTADPNSVGTVGPLRFVQSETAPIPFDTAPYPTFYPIATHPHVGVKGNRAIIVWDRRTGPANILLDFWYFNSDIVAKFTDDDGATFSALQTVSAAPGFQYQPSISVDTTGTVVVAYYSHENDAPFFHKQDVYIATSPTGAAPYTPLRVTPVSNDTQADPLLSDSAIGDYLEVACTGGVGYVHYTANYVAKETSFFDGGSTSLLVRQQDNFLGKVTLP